MRLDKKILNASFIFGFLFWVMDSVVDFYFFNEEAMPYLKILLNPGPSDIVDRTAILMAMIVSGTIIAWHVNKLIKSESDLANTLLDYRNLLDEQNLTMENVNDFIYRHDKDGVFSYLSPSVERITGYSQEDFKTQYAHFLTDSSSLGHLDSSMKDIGEFPSREIEIFQRNGNRICLELNESPFCENGEFEGIVGVARDITDRKHTQKELEVSERNYREIYNTSNDAILVLDMESAGILDVNDRMCEMYGYSRDEVEAIDLHMLSSGPMPQIQDDIFRFFRKVIKEGPRSFKWRSRRKNGKVFWVEMSLKKTSIGGSDRILAMVRDIHERMQVEEALELTQFSMDNASIPTFWMGPDAKFIYVNHAAAESLGYSSEELLRMSVFDIDPNFDQERWIPHWEGLKNAGSMTIESIHRKKDGTEFPVEISIKLLEYGGQEYNLAFVKDITERRISEIEIRKKNDALEAALEVKNDFISMVSHELRTPLVPIVGYSELLLDGSFGAMPEASIEPINAVLTRARDLTRLIDDLLVVSRMDRGQLILDPMPLSVSHQILETMSDYKQIETNKEVSINWEGEDFIVLADHARFHQIVRNLIDNAIKYSGDTVDISIHTERNVEMGLISVTDNGIGIPEEEQDKIFDKFYQIEDVETRSHGGTGLGLAITKDLVKLMNGNISVDSSPGAGSTFTVELPLAKELV